MIVCMPVSRGMNLHPTASLWSKTGFNKLL